VLVDIGALWRETAMAGPASLRSSPSAPPSPRSRLLTLLTRGCAGRAADAGGDADGSGSDSSADGSDAWSSGDEEDVWRSS
jgi:hypothetical protein